LKDDMPLFNSPVEFVVCGGTSLIKGFIGVFEQELRNIELQIDIAKVRLARDPLKTVALGCMQSAIEEMKAQPLIEQPE